MDAHEQAEAARRLAVALDLAGIDIEAPKSSGANLTYVPANPAAMLAVLQQKLFRVSLRREHGARIVGTIGPDGAVRYTEPEHGDPAR